MLDKIKVGAFDYQIVMEDQYDSKGNRYDGLADYAYAKISISPQMDDKVQLETFLHEIIHVIMHQAGFNNHSENLVEALSYGLLQIFRDNPEFSDLFNIL